MSETLYIPNTENKEEKYVALLHQIKSLIETEDDLIANLANITAVIKEAFRFFWVGFYIQKNGELVLGPFQGTLACTRIQIGRGVCGQSVLQQKTLIVDDVDAFPGHIACSSLSKSEIVVPLIINQYIPLILDVDHDTYAHFNFIDETYLTQILQLIGSKHFENL